MAARVDGTFGVGDGYSSAFAAFRPLCAFPFSLVRKSYKHRSSRCDDLESAVQDVYWGLAEAATTPRQEPALSSRRRSSLRGVLLLKSNCCRSASLVARAEPSAGLYSSHARSLQRLLLGKLRRLICRALLFPPGLGFPLCSLLHSRLQSRFTNVGRLSAESASILIGRVRYQIRRRSGACQCLLA